MSRDMRFPTMWYVRPAAKAQTSRHIRAVWSEPLLVPWIFYNYKLLTEHHLEFLSLKRGSSESIHVKMPQWWKSHVAAQMHMNMKPAHIFVRFTRLFTSIKSKRNLYVKSF